MKKNLLCLIMILGCLLLCGCSEKENNEEILLGIDYNVEGNESDLSNFESEFPLVAMYIENYGSIVMELYPNIAENTVNNFISLVKSGFYDNNTFHRLVPGFVLQGGDPGTGGPGYTIKGEFNRNDYKNDLKHTEGIISMARSNGMNTAGSQFFIMLGTAEHLDGNYAAFGKIIEGMDIIKKIAKNEKIQDVNSGKLSKNLTIKKALVDCKDYKAKKVIKIEN